MKSARLFGVVLVLGALAAFAVNVGMFDIPQWFKGGLYVLPASQGALVTSANKITNHHGTTPATTAWDFTVMGSHALQAPCIKTGVFPLTGVKHGDGCTVQSELGSDAGVGQLDTATLSCITRQGGVQAQMCVALTDGGTYDPGDAGLWFHTWSNQ